MRIGSLFSGYGGLDLAVMRVLGGELAWVADVEPGPRVILARHWPGVPKLGDVTTVDWSRVEPVDVITGGSPCFVAGTPVLTHDGLRPIEDVQVGDLVWTHAARWQRVTHTMRRTSETVELRSGFYCTPEHRLWLRAPQQQWNNTIRQYRRHLDTPEWVEAKDSRGLFAASPVSVTHEGVAKPDTLTWWQIGRFVADGYVNNQVNVYIGKDKESDADNFPGWVHHQQETALCLTMPKSAAERDWLTGHFGKLAHGKTIPTFLLAETEENRRAFLDGYWSGDGWKPEGRRFTQSNSVSACLTTGIELLAKSLGYTCTVSQCQVTPTKVIEGRTVNQRPWWTVRATPDDGRFTETDADWHWFKLRRTPKAGEVTTVYDLTVERDHSFIAAGIVVHNCQDLSLAGARRGMTAGTRSNLWVAMREAVAVLRPRMVVWENVRGALSAAAESEADHEDDLGLGAGLLGDGAGRPALRALGRVLGDLADLGFDAEWRGLRAADVGAPHGRFRVFVVARAADADGGRLEGHAQLDSEPAPGTADRDSRGGDAHGCSPADTSGIADERRRVGGELRRAPGATQGEAHQRERGWGAPPDRGETALMPTPQAHDAAKGKTTEQVEAMRARTGAGVLNLNEVAENGVEWGKYAPAIARWERVLGRPAPAPTDHGRLSARFVEWMMGLPDGWVTGVPISRSAQLRALGNGVVPQQASTVLEAMIPQFSAGKVRAEGLGL